MSHGIAQSVFRPWKDVSKQCHVTSDVVVPGEVGILLIFLSVPAKDDGVIKSDM